jgi:pyruvate/2-oxoglutarate dehydrogenase complex dihydrolipoamide dehydrogenase (E3) component
MNEEPEVLIVGGGPAGLTAARTLARHGIDSLLVVDREPEAGGIPRFCPHPTFGLSDFFRPMSGPHYAAKLRASVDPGQVASSTTVTSIDSDLAIRMSSERGESIVLPKRVLLATGIRETPRAARLVSGDRPQNVLTTGAVQRLVAEGHGLPFRAPVVVGTELVSFSAVLTLHDAGIDPVAMIEAGPRIVARRPMDVLTRFFLRTNVRCNCRIAAINAEPDDTRRMASITVENPMGGQSTIACDAVVFTGGFVPEISLLGKLPASLRDTNSKGPRVDQRWRLADPRLYAAGNILRSVETAAWSAREGRAAAEAIAADLRSGALVAERMVPIRVADPIAFSIPSLVAVPGPALNRLQMAVRMARPARGRFTLAADGAVFWRSHSVSVLPERRILLSRNLPDLDNVAELQIGFEHNH